MTGLKLFRIGDKQVKELESHSTTIEKSLQTLIEKNLGTMLGMRFVASEIPTAKGPGGRIDTLGLDENLSPVVIKYKRALNENILGQGVFYLDWLMANRTKFHELAAKALAVETADTVQWNQPRLVLISGDYSRFDMHTADQLDRNIELVRCRQFDIGFLLLELVHVAHRDCVSSPVQELQEGCPEAGGGGGESATARLERSERSLFDLYQSLVYFLEALGDDVHRVTFPSHFAFRRLRNFLCAVPDPDAKGHRLYLNLDPSQAALHQIENRDVGGMPHPGSGDLEILIKDENDLERAKPLLIESYEAN